MKKHNILTLLMVVLIICTVLGNCFALRKMNEQLNQNEASLTEIAESIDECNRIIERCKARLNELNGGRSNDQD